MYTLIAKNPICVVFFLNFAIFLLNLTKLIFFTVWFFTLSTREVKQLTSLCLSHLFYANSLPTGTYEGWSRSSWTRAVKFLSLSQFCWLIIYKYNEYFKIRREIVRNKIDITFYRIKGIATRRSPTVTLWR